MLTTKQAAVIAGVSPSMIYQWTTVERRLPHYRAGGKGKRGRILIDPADLEQFMRSLRVEGETAASAPVSSGSAGGSFSELDPRRLQRAWQKD